MQITYSRVLGVVLALFFSITLPAHAEFTFNKGDHICLIGNSLASRMQHDGWLETLLQSRLGDKQLVFRNLAFPGDRVKSRNRRSYSMSGMMGSSRT